MPGSDLHRAGRGGPAAKTVRAAQVPAAGHAGQVRLELAGRTAARLAGTLGIAVHPATVLRLVAAAPEPEVGGRRADLGVDDFALAKGQGAGTVLVDMGTGDVIDLLPEPGGRQPRGVADGASRRGDHLPGPGGPATTPRARRAGAPDAIQVADRWHLWHDAGRIRPPKAVAEHRGCLADPLLRPRPLTGPDAPPGQQPQDGPGAAPRPGPDGLRDVCGRERVLVPRTLERHAAVHDLLQAGHIPAGDRRASWAWTASTVQPVRPRARAPPRCWSRPPAGTASWTRSSRTSASGGTRASPTPPSCTPNWPPPRAGPAACRPSGATSASSAPPAGGQRQAVPPSPRRPPRQSPKTRQITRWLLTRPGHLDADDQAQLAAVTRPLPAPGRARRAHPQLRRDDDRTARACSPSRTGSPRVEADDQPQLRSFASGIRRDQQAVTAGLALPYSSAAMEGNVNKIKMIKRQMYGRASFPLLRKRVILHPA